MKLSRRNIMAILIIMCGSIIAGAVVGVCCLSAVSSREKDIEDEAQLEYLKNLDKRKYENK